MKHTRMVLVACFAVLVGVIVAFPTAVLATNGMNLEGYGPVATGMGGASMAYDNGSAAMMNNPATLSLMPEGNRLDVALGYLGPDITASVPGMSADSSATSFLMPALGWVARSGNMSYGLGMFAQGGMGTEYDAFSFMAAGSNLPVRSEVSVGRILVPVAYDMSPNFKIGGSVDFVWAGMDLKMALSGAQFLDMAGSFGGSMMGGSVSGSMMTAFGGAVAGGFIDPANPVNWGRFDFSDKSDYTGKAKGTGFAAKIGGVYKVNDEINLGFAYHSKTALDDLEAKGATVTFNANFDPTGGGGPFAPMSIPVTGTIEVKDFEWPQMAAFGASYKVTNQLMLVADYKWINWKDVMKNFRMVFTADYVQSPMATGFAGTVLDATMYQKWEDQNVFMLGAAYAVNDMFTLRAGANIANNPIPNAYLNPLFPAIIKNHYTLGAGIIASKASTVDLSMTYAPEVTATNGEGVTVVHSQTNGQIMYSYRF